jgi:hypothetical protein
MPPVDFKIRPIGRPQVSEDSSLGYRKLTRRFVVEGPKVSEAGINSGTSKLFRDVGEKDEEFTDYYLVAQQVEPTTSVDKAYLNRTYVQFRNSWFGESLSENKNTKRLSRRYMVLKQSENALPTGASGLGYGDDVWRLHPASANYSAVGDSTEPWDMLPDLIKNSEPSNLVDVTAAKAASHPLSYDITSLSGMLTDALALSPAPWVSWVRGSAQVDTSNPGFDVWNVSWIAPSVPHWSMGAVAGSQPPVIIDINENGLSVVPSTSSDTTPVISNFTFFFVGENIPAPLLPNPGVTPYVVVDFYMQGKSGGMRSTSRTYKNAVFTKAANTDAKLRFRDTAGDLVEVASKTGPIVAGIPAYGGGTMAFNFNAGPKDKFSVGTFVQTSSGSSGSGGSGGTWQGGGIPIGWSTPLPLYQGQEIISAGGHISWTHMFLNQIGGNLVKTTVESIHAYRGEHIWRINCTFA